MTPSGSAALNRCTNRRPTRRTAVSEKVSPCSSAISWSESGAMVWSMMSLATSSRTATASGTRSEDSGQLPISIVAVTGWHEWKSARWLQPHEGIAPRNGGQLQMLRKLYLGDANDREKGIASMRCPQMMVLTLVNLAVPVCCPPARRATSLRRHASGQRAPRRYRTPNSHEPSRQTQSRDRACTDRH